MHGPGPALTAHPASLTFKGRTEDGPSEMPPAGSGSHFEVEGVTAAQGPAHWTDSRARRLFNIGF